MARLNPPHSSVLRHIDDERIVRFGECSARCLVQSVAPDPRYLDSIMRRATGGNPIPNAFACMFKGTENWKEIKVEGTFWVLVPVTRH